MELLLDFLVRTSVLQKVMEKELKEKGQGCGDKSFEQLTIWDQVGCSLKTVPESKEKDEKKSSMRSWRVDIPGKMESLERLMPVLRIKGIGGGFLLPTLTVCGNWNRKGASKTSGDGLATVLKMMPTLCATDYKSPYSVIGYKKQMQKRSKPLRDFAKHHLGIRLTPGLCEWYMGFPIGHTDLEVSETQSSQSSLNGSAEG
jgi:hypothetical protein